MPIGVRHKSTGDVKEVSVYVWDQKHINHNTWDIIREKDLVQLYYHPPKGDALIRHRMEKQDAFDFVKINPDYTFDDLPDTLNPSVMAKAAVGIFNKNIALMNLPNPTSQSESLRDAEPSPIIPPILQDKTQPKSNSHVGNRVWNVTKKIFIFCIENPLVSAIIAGIILYLIVVVLSNHNIKPKQ